MKSKKALKVLAAFFECEEKVFNGLDKNQVIEWAIETRNPHYQLQNWQHNHLINLPC